MLEQNSMDVKNYYNCKLTRNRIDLYLYEMAKIFCNIGTDSTLEEIQEAYKQESEWIDKIAELDAEKANNLRASY
jgi:NDP-sugar pyrophosphorylase family protein